MKNLLILLGAALALGACQTISTDPAPARATRDLVLSATYAAINPLPANSTDTALVNPKLEVYLVTPQPQADGSVFYPLTATDPVATVTNFRTPQPLALGTVTVSDGQPAPIVRFVFSSDNRPGRRSAAQKISASLLVGGTVRGAAVTYTGRDFSRTAAPAATAPAFRKQTDLAVAIY